MIDLIWYFLLVHSEVFAFISISSPNKHLLVGQNFSFMIDVGLCVPIQIQRTSNEYVSREMNSKNSVFFVL